MHAGIGCHGNGFTIAPLPVAAKRRVAIALCLSFLLPARFAAAQVAVSYHEMRSVGEEARGLPVEVFVQKPLPLLAREMLLQSHLEENSNVPRPQRKGVQVELFAPGDFGLVVRYRW